MNFANSRQTSSTSNNNSGGSGGANSSLQVKYIYDLPYFDRKEICRIFDENNQWETLGGGLMGYTTSELSEFGRAVYRGASPTDALLTSWGNQNHTVLELFTLFNRLLHARGMKVLAKYVDLKYHVYIRDPDFQATAELVAGIDPPNPGVGGGGAEAKEQNVAAEKNKAEGDGKAKEPSKDEKAKLASLADSVGLLPQIPYGELATATNNWDRRNMLGKGGFGTVYKGLWKNTAVAIKRMEQRTANANYVESQMKQSLGEMRFLNSYRHDNILPLYGFSLEGEHPCLVYQFMTNGSLEDRLLCRQRTTPLSWHLRFHIAKGVACGIQFLHSIGAQPLIHGDIKSANILLDRNFEAKVGDFGLAREMTQTTTSAQASYVKVSRVHGTRPYLPDEYLRSKKLSTKVDTYSFGIVLFELASGLRAYEEQRHKKFLKDMVEEFDGILEKLKDAKAGHDNPDVFFILMNLGRVCTERIAKKRPEMVEVLKSLETSMPQTQASSIRTISTHVTGLPYLFEMPLSRPGSLGIPVTSYTTNRNSPEMRAGSPHWVAQGQGQNQNRPWESGVSPSPFQFQPLVQQGSNPQNQNQNPHAQGFQGFRKTSQASPPLPGPPLPPQTLHFQPIHPHSPHGHGQGPLPSPVMSFNINQQQLTPEPPPLAPSPSPSPFSQAQANPHQSHSNNNQFSNITNNTTSSHKTLNTMPTMPVNVNLPLSIDTNVRPLIPELLLVQASPSPLPQQQPLEKVTGIGVGAGVAGHLHLPPHPQPTTIAEDDELYLPLVLDEHTSSSKSDPTESNADGPATVIPLITELGFKDKDDES